MELEILLLEAKLAFWDEHLLRLDELDSLRLSVDILQHANGALLGDSESREKRLQILTYEAGIKEPLLVDADELTSTKMELVLAEAELEWRRNAVGQLHLLTCVANKKEVENKEADMCRDQLANAECCSKKCYKVLRTRLDKASNKNFKMQLMLNCKKLEYANLKEEFFALRKLLRKSKLDLADAKKHLCRPRKEERQDIANVQTSNQSAFEAFFGMKSPAKIAGYELQDIKEFMLLPRRKIYERVFTGGVPNTAELDEIMQHYNFTVSGVISQREYDVYSTTILCNVDRSIAIFSLGQDQDQPDIERTNSILLYT